MPNAEDLIGQTAWKEGKQYLVLKTLAPEEGKLMVVWCHEEETHIYPLSKGMRTLDGNVILVSFEGDLEIVPKGTKLYTDTEVLEDIVNGFTVATSRTCTEIYRESTCLYSAPVLPNQSIEEVHQSTINFSKGFV